MSRLLNALLDISKLESGAIKPEPTDFVVAKLFEELRSEFAQLASNKGLELQVEPCADCVHSDPSLIEQILRNLVANAIKYTREGWVRLRCLHETGVVRIEVLDSGVGIAPDQLPFIYDEFYQVGVPTNTVREGYGLGLSIVQRLVKLLDVKLSVQSEPGKGTVFALDLPAGIGQDRGLIRRAPLPTPQLAPQNRHTLWSWRTILRSWARHACCSRSRAIGSQPRAHLPRPSRRRVSTRISACSSRITTSAIARRVPT